MDTIRYKPHIFYLNKNLFKFSYVKLELIREYLYIYIWSKYFIKSYQLCELMFWIINNYDEEILFHEH